MKRISILSISILLILTNGVPTINSDEQLRGITLFVGGSGPGNYSTIQSAIDNASNGDTVFVFNGTYFGHILINKSINFIGEDKNTTFITGYIAYTLSIVADWVNISRFTIQNGGCLGEGVRIDSCYNSFFNNIINTPNDNIRISGDSNTISGNTITSDSIVLSGDSNTISGNTITNNYYGIYCTYCNKNIISNNSFFKAGLFISDDTVWNKIVTNNTINGKPLVYVYDESDLVINVDAGQIILINCTNITVQNQEIFNTTVGIQIRGSNNCVISGNNIVGNHYGIWINGWNNIINDNIIINNNYEGLRLSGDKNAISGNTISNNDDGIYLYYSNQNNIINNTITTNNYEGIQLEYGCDLNNIINNTITTNNDYGINLHSTSNNNSIYNNFFSNIDNYHDDGNNIWNISITPGTNIIGGPYLGGNYWSDYTGVDTDGDGLGNTNIPYGPGDYLPLTYPQMNVNQSEFDRGFPVRHTLDGDWGGAQNFTPSVDTITSVDLYLRKMGTPEFDLTVELRQDGPQGALLDTVVIPAVNVSGTWTWLTIDFANTIVGSGSDVFIVCPQAPPGQQNSFGYEWGYAMGNQYDGGSFWFTRNGGSLWRDLPTMYEFCFKTYGYW